VTEQLAFTLAAATVVFASAVFFCIGNASNTSAKIMLQAAPFWDFSQPAARALAAQRAQYVAGALLLVIAFLLQVAAALAPATTLAALPQSLHTWPYLVAAVLLPTLFVAFLAARLLYERTIRKVLRLEAEQREGDKRLASTQGKS